MTKAEKAALAAIQTAHALRWPQYPRPVPMTPDEQREAAQGDEGVLHKRELVGALHVFAGWSPLHHTQGRVRRMWTDGRRQGSIHDDGSFDNGSRPLEPGEMRPIYRTEREAWQALRYMIADAAASDLARVDERLAALQ